MSKKTIVFFVLAGFVVLSALAISYSGAARLPLSSGFEPNPEPATPDQSLIPVVDVRSGIGWAAGNFRTQAQDSVAIFRVVEGDALDCAGEIVHAGKYKLPGCNSIDNSG